MSSTLRPGQGDLHGRSVGLPGYRRQGAVPPGASGPAVVSSLVWLASRRDLGWWRRRFVIGVGAITLVLALTLPLSGFRDGIDVETAWTGQRLQRRRLRGPRGGEWPVHDRLPA